MSSTPAEKTAEQRVQELEARVVGLTADLDAANSVIAEMKASKRKEQVITLFSKLGKPASSLTDADLTPYLGMDEAAFSMVSAHMLASKPAAPASLFSHTAEQGPEIANTPDASAANALLANAQKRGGNA